MSPLAEALHDAFYAQEGKGLMGAALWEAMAEHLYDLDVGFMTGP